jgi:hypothetical protein
MRIKTRASQPALRQAIRGHERRSSVRGEAAVSFGVLSYSPQGGDVPLSPDGGLSFDSGVPVIGKVRTGLQYSGTLPLKDVLRNPRALLQNPAAQKLAKELLGRLLER